MAAEIAHIALPAQGHRDIQFLADDVERQLYARLAKRAEPVEERTADQAPFGAERKRAQAAIKLTADRLASAVESKCDNMGTD